MFEVFKNKDNQDGFTLIEVVVAVVIVLILAIGAIVGYGMVQDNARDAAVEAAASDVYTGIEAERHNPRGKTVEQVVSDYNTSADGVSVSAVQGDSDICVTSVYDSKPQHTAERGDCNTTVEDTIVVEDTTIYHVSYEIPFVGLFGISEGYAVVDFEGTITDFNSDERSEFITIELIDAGVWSVNVMDILDSFFADDAVAEELAVYLANNAEYDDQELINIIKQVEHISSGSVSVDAGNITVSVSKE